MDLGRAMQMLKMSRKGYLVQADRKQKETEQERQKLLTRMDDIISDLNNLNGKLDQINEKEESLRMHPGDENGAVILDERMAQAKAKRNSFAMGMLISAVAGIFGLILTAIIADSVSVSLIVAVIAAALNLEKFYPTPKEGETTMKGFKVTINSEENGEGVVVVLDLEHPVGVPEKAKDVHATSVIR